MSPCETCRIAGRAGPGPIPLRLRRQWGQLRCAALFLRGSGLSLSEQYGGLADVSLTLADYCLVLTLSQVDGVDAVQIQSAGHTYHSRSHQTMQAEEAILDQEALSAPGD